MKTIRLIVDLEYDNDIMFREGDPEEERWFRQEILGDAEGLWLHSQEIGDEVGKVIVRGILEDPPTLLRRDGGKGKGGAGICVSVRREDILKMMEEEG